MFLFASSITSRVPVELYPRESRHQTKRTPNQSRWMNLITGKRENIVWWTVPFSSCLWKQYREQQPTAGFWPNRTRSSSRKSVWHQWGSVFQTDYCAAPEPASLVWSHSDPCLVRKHTVFLLLVLLQNCTSMYSALFLHSLSSRT